MHMLKTGNQNYIAAAFSDRGAIKKINQDKICLRKKSVESGEALLAVVCGGMGGMARGDVAANTVVREFAIWFCNHLEEVIEKPQRIVNDWTAIIGELNERIWGYGKQKKIRLGTTLTVMVLLPDGRYYTANVGNNRFYHLEGKEIRQKNEQPSGEKGEKNKIYVGCSELVSPSFADGSIHIGESILLCTDGFCCMHRKKTDKNLMEENYEKDEDIRKRLEEVIRDMTNCGGKDNISAILVKAN